MADQELKSTIVVAAEDQTKSTFQDIKSGAADMASSVQQSGEKAAKGIEGIGNGADNAAQKLTRAEGSIAQALQRATEKTKIAAQAGESLSRAFEQKIELRGLDASKLNPFVQQLREAENALAAVKAQQAQAAGQNAFLDSLRSQTEVIGKTKTELLELKAAQLGMSTAAAPYIAKLKEAEVGIGKVGMSAAQTANAMRTVPAQFTDIVVSLQSGQAPLTVLLQQGGQLKDMFGGAGNAAKALGSYVLGLVNPFTVAAAAVAALGAAYYQGSKEQDAFVKAIVLTGNASGMTTSQLHDYARQIDAVIGTQAQAAAGLAAFTAAGVQGGDELRRYTQTAIEWERATGQAVEKTAEQFASLQKDPLAAVLKLNEGTNFLTTSVYEQIKALDEQGKKTEAAEVAMNALDATMRERAKAIEGSLGYLERAWRGIRSAAAEAWDAMLNIGRPTTLNDQLEEVEKKLETALANQSWGETEGGAATGRVTAAYKKQVQESIDALTEQKWALTEKMNAESMAAAVSAESARQTQSLIEFDKKWAKALEEKKTLTQKLTEAEAEARANNKSDADIKRIQAFITEEHNKGLKKAKDGTKAYNRELDQQKSLMAELSGLSTTFYKDWDRLNKMYAQGRISLSDLEKEQSKLLAKQPFSVALAKEEEKAAKELKKAIDDDIKAFEKLGQQRENAIKSANDSVQKALEEEQAYVVAASANITLAEAKERVTLARLNEHLAMARAGAESQETIDRLEREIAAHERMLEVMGQKGVREANKKAQDQITKDWEKLSETVGRTLADYIMGGGKDAATYLRRLFATLVLQPMVNYGVQSLMGGPSGSGSGSVMPGSSLTDWSTWGGKGSDWLFDQGVGMSFKGYESLGSSMQSLGVTIGRVDSYLKTIPGMSGGIGSAAGYLGSIYALTQGQYGTGLGSAIGTLALPGIGTMIGGALGGLVDGLFGGDSIPRYAATAEYRGGVTSKGWTPDGQWNDAIYPTVSALAQGIGSALDATAKTFGQTAGYELFASFSKDAESNMVFGALNITGPDGKSLVDWSQYNKDWGGRFFSDGEAGEKEFMAAITADVKTAFQAMDLPGWSKQLIGAAEDINGINAALQQIGAVKAVFDGLGQSMQMFSGISGELQTQLLQTSGSMDALAGNAGAFYEGFYSEQERMGILARNLRESLSGLNLSIDPALGDDAKESFRAAIEAAMAGGQGELSAKLLAMSQSFVTAADYAQKATDSLRSSLIDLEFRFGNGDAARRLQAQNAASQVQGLLSGVGIHKDAGALAQTLLSATAADVESYFREIWNVLDTDAARQQLVDVTGAMLDLAEASGSAEDKTQALADRVTSALAAMNSAGSLLDRIDGALGGTGNGYSLLREQRLWAAMAEADYTQQIDLAGQLTDMVLGRYQLEQQNAQKQIDFARSLRSYVDGLKLGNLSPLTMGEKLSEAAKQYADTLTKAQAGDESAMSALQGISSSYLDLARQYYASSDAYTQIFGNVTGSLDALGLSSQTDAQRQLDVSSQSLDQLRALQGVLEGAYGQAEADYAAQRDLLQSQIDYAAQTATGIDAMVQLLAGLPAEIGLRMGAAGKAGGTSYSDIAQQWVRLMQPYGLQKSGAQVAGELSSMSAADLQRNYEIGAGLLGNGAQRDEWDALIAKLRGGLIDGSHAGGLDYVPFDGYLAQLHKGERVMTAAENRAYTPTWANYGMGDGVQALVAEVKALRAEISQLKASGDQNAQMLARAAFESNRENAQEVVRGVGQSTVRAAWGQTLEEGAKLR